MASTDPIYPHSQWFAQIAVNCSSVVILFYDYFITLGSEVKYFWPPKSRFTAVSFIFFFNRYFTLLAHIPVVVSLRIKHGPAQATICPQLIVFHEYVGMFIEVNVGVLLVVRTYALYDRSKIILFTLCGLLFAFSAYGIWAIAEDQANFIKYFSLTPAYTEGYTGCFIYMPEYAAHRLLGTWICVLVFDLIIFLLTVRKAWARRRTDRLMRIFMRDGSMYFLAMTAANALNIYLLVAGSPLTRGILVPFINAISVNLALRLMLNIRSSHFRHTSNRLDNAHGLRLSRLTTRKRPAFAHQVVSGDYNFGNTSDGSALRFTTIIMDDVGIQRDGAVIGAESSSGEEGVLGGKESEVGTGSKKYEGVYDAGGEFGYGYVDARSGVYVRGGGGGNGVGAGAGGTGGGKTAYNDGTAGSSSTSASASTSGHRDPNFGSKAKKLLGPSVGVEEVDRRRDSTANGRGKARENSSGPSRGHKFGFGRKSKRKEDNRSSDNVVRPAQDLPSPRPGGAKGSPHAEPEWLGLEMVRSREGSPTGESGFSEAENALHAKGYDIREEEAGDEEGGAISGDGTGNFVEGSSNRGHGGGHGVDEFELVPVTPSAAESWFTRKGWVSN